MPKFKYPVMTLLSCCTSNKSHNTKIPGKCEIPKTKQISFSNFLA